MKKLIATIFLIVFAFTMVDAQIKKPTKTKIPTNKGFQKTEVKQKIDKNTILESDLFAFYNRSELRKLTKEKKIVLAKIKSGNKSAEAKMRLLGLKENKLNTNLAAATFFSNRIKKTGKIGPINPCPPKDDGKCLIDVLKRLLVSNKIKMKIKVLDHNKNNIGYLEEKPSYSNTKLGLNGYKLVLKKKYVGNVYLDITRIEANTLKTNYIIEGVLKLP